MSSSPVSSDSSDRLVVVRPSPLNAEAPSAALGDVVTPTPLAYVRSNFPTPALDADGHRVAVCGAVARPSAVDVAALRTMPQRTVVTTMECAGNDRATMRPLPAGEPWQSGAVSTARWTGVPLRDVLEACGVTPDAVEVVATGADAGPRDDAPDGCTVPFARALPLADALAPDTLLALAMNDAPLPPEHGAPVRLVVPGWYGMASVKWVARLDVRTTPFDGYFQRRRYVYDTPDGVDPVARMRVKSVIVAPGDEARVRPGRTRFWGWAWSGDGAIAAVEVAVDGDGAWQRAGLETPASPHAWTRWSLDVELAPGRHLVRARATDASGATQPDVAPWNRLGYGNNAVRPILVDARDEG